MDKTIHVTAAIGRFYIETCRKIMLSLEDFNEISDIEWHNALDTIFLVAASVDGIADQDGRSVGAHAFTMLMSKSLREDGQHMVRLLRYVVCFKSY